MDTAKALAFWIIYRLQFWYLKYRLRLVAYRRNELTKIVAHEYVVLDNEEHEYNVRLRELQHAELNSRLVKAPT